MAKVRSEQPGDEEAVRALLTASFPTVAEAALVDALRSARHLTISLVAAEGNAIVGHVGFSPVTVASGPVGVGLAPLAVAEPYRGQGVAAALVTEGLAACRAAGFAWAVVLGEPAYYSRFGYRPAADFGLADEYGGGTAFQVLALLPDGIPAGAGLVRYSPEFAAFG